MQDNLERQLEELAKKVMTSSILEQPPVDFTTRLMINIEASPSNVTTYKPLISKWVWFVITTLIIVVISYLFFGTELQNSGWFGGIDFSVFSNNKVSETLLGFTFTVSNTVAYAVVFFGLAFLVQLTVLKNYHQKQLNS